MDGSKPPTDEFFSSDGINSVGKLSRIFIIPQGEMNDKFDEIWRVDLHSVMTYL